MVHPFALVQQIATECIPVRHSVDYHWLSFSDHESDRAPIGRCEADHLVKTTPPEINSLERRSM
jgi:hypothetical protein